MALDFGQAIGSVVGVSMAELPVWEGARVVLPAKVGSAPWKVYGVVVPLFSIHPVDGKGAVVIAHVEGYTFLVTSSLSVNVSA